MIGVAMSLYTNLYNCAENMLVGALCPHKVWSAKCLNRSVVTARGPPQGMVERYADAQDVVWATAATGREAMLNAPLCVSFVILHATKKQGGGMTRESYEDIR